MRYQSCNTNHAQPCRCDTHPHRYTFGSFIPLSKTFEIHTYSFKPEHKLHTFTIQRRTCSCNIFAYIVTVSTFQHSMNLQSVCIQPHKYETYRLINITTLHVHSDIYELTPWKLRHLHVQPQLPHTCIYPN